jgi:hypothetical protein
VQAHQERGIFFRLRIAPVVFLAELVERELRASRAFPEERGVDFVRELLRVGDELGKRPVLEPDQDVGRLDLGALAVLGFDLQRRVVVGKDGADLEVAVLLLYATGLPFRQDANPSTMSR